MEYDYHDPEGDIAKELTNTLGRKVDAIIRERFKGWNGKIRHRNIELEVDLIAIFLEDE
jgi:hypothetical protein